MVPGSMADPTITADDLTFAGITGTLAAALLGKTMNEARAKFVQGLELGLAAATLKRGSVVSFSVDGQSQTADVAQVRAVIAFLTARQSSGFGVMMGVRL